MNGHEQMPAHRPAWPVWRSLNRLPAGVGRSKDRWRRWGFPIRDLLCEEQTTSQMLPCAGCPSTARWKT